MMYGDIVEYHRKNCTIKNCNYIPNRYRTREDQEFDNVSHSIPFFSEESPKGSSKVPSEEVDRLVNNSFGSLLGFSDFYDSGSFLKNKHSQKSYFKQEKRGKDLYKKFSKIPLKSEKEQYFEDIHKKERSIKRKNTGSVRERKSCERLALAPIEDNIKQFINTQPPLDSPSKRPRLRENPYFEDMSYQETYAALSNGFGRCSNGDIWDSSVATLVNMGNTCYLNSVLYALRFLPSFMHNLHHLLVDLSLKMKETKAKTSSLGRNGSSINGANWRSASSKDLLSIGNDIMPKSKKQIVTEKLHSLYITMHDLEMKDSPDAYQPKALLQAIKDANKIFEGNEQQDAHELLGMLLCCCRVTIDELNEQIKRHQITELTNESSELQSNVTNNRKQWSWKTSMRKKKDKDKSSKDKMSNTVISTQPVLLEHEQENNPDLLTSVFYDRKDGDSENSSTNGESDTSPSNKKLGYNFVTEDLEGMALHRTRCLECEAVSERKEPFLEIQVPVIGERIEEIGRISSDEVFGMLCVSSEKLCDQNKYYCEECNRYNEAKREVLYEKLPNIMIFQLKRFTSNIEKVNTFVPTPLELRCFCISCTRRTREEIPEHRYKLFCVIMHLGPNMASGHYITYSRVSCQTVDYAECSRDTPKTTNAKDSPSFFKFLRSKALISSNVPSETTQNGIGVKEKKNEIQVCQSVNCCGVRCKPPSPLEVDNWFEFDDNNFKVLSSRQFTDILNKRNDSLTNTPYLLFYSKI